MSLYVLPPIEPIRIKDARKEVEENEVRAVSVYLSLLYRNKFVTNKAIAPLIKQATVDVISTGKVSQQTGTKFRELFREIVDTCGFSSIITKENEKIDDAVFISYFDKKKDTKRFFLRDGTKWREIFITPKLIKISPVSVLQEGLRIESSNIVF